MTIKSKTHSLETPPKGATHFDEGQFFRVGFRDRTYRWTYAEWIRSSKELTDRMTIAHKLKKKHSESARLKEQSKKMINRPRTPKFDVKRA